MKVNVANASQKTLEMSKDIAKFRLLQQNIIASWDEKFKEQKIQKGDKREHNVKKQKTEIVIKLQKGKKREQTVKKQKTQTVSKLQTGSKREQAVKKQKTQTVSRLQTGSKREQTVKKQKTQTVSKLQTGSKREQAVKKQKTQTVSRLQTGSKREQTVKKQKTQTVSKLQTGSKREQTVKEGLEFDYAKISKELHPSLDLSCNHDIIKPTETKKNAVIIGCMIKNNGVHNVYIVPLGITMLEHMEQKMIDNAIESTDYLYPTISAPGNNSNRKQYKVTLTEYGIARLKKGYSFQISFKASTVETGLDKIRRQVKGAIKDSKLKEMSEFNYDYVMAL